MKTLGQGGEKKPERERNTYGKFDNKHNNEMAALFIDKVHAFCFSMNRVSDCICAAIRIPLSAENGYSILVMCHTFHVMIKLIGKY